MKECISTGGIKYEGVDDKALKWDLIKMEIRNISIGYAKRKRRKQKENEKNIRQRYSELFDILQSENNVAVQNEFLLVKRN